MRQLVLIMALLLCHVQSFSQIKIETERDKENNIRFYAVNDEIIPYSIIIEFTDLVNLTPSGGMKTFAVANPGRTAVGKLTKNVTNQSDNYRYSTHTHKGNYKAKTKTDLAYLVPLVEGESVTLSSMTHIGNRINSEAYNDAYVGVSFRFKNPTIICAPRKGIVSDVKVEEELTGNSYTYSALDNYIELYHEDGTFTKVSVVKSGSAKVKKGDIVYPGTPLAESAGEKYQSGPHVRIINSKVVLKDDKFGWETFPVTFFANSGSPVMAEGEEYMTEHPAALVTKEMSKREMKKLIK